MLFSRRRMLEGLLGAAVSPLAVAHSTNCAQAATEAALAEIENTLTGSKRGKVVRPGTRGHSLIGYHNARFDCRRSTTFLQPNSTEAVHDIVTWARRNGQPFAIRGQGHSFEGKSSHPELVVDLSNMRELQFVDGRLTVQPGVQLGDVYGKLVPAGFVMPAGTCPTVGIIGHSLGGGIGDFLPILGYAAQSLTEVTIVTLGGTVLRVNDQGVTVVAGAPMEPGTPEPAKLMRVLRGAGQGSIGIVTEAKFAPHDLRKWAFGSFRLEGAGDLAPERFAELIALWQTWHDSLPQNMQDIVSSKMDTNRSASGFDAVVGGIIAIPEGRGITTADVRKTLAPLFDLPHWSKKRQFAARVGLAEVYKSFIDDDETTFNKRRRKYYGASSLLPAALPRTALDHLVRNFPRDVDASLYTAGGRTKTAPETALHPGEYIYEWVASSPAVYSQVRALIAATAQVAGFANHALPSYPDLEQRDYFADSAEVEAMRARFDPDSLSVSSLLFRPQNQIEDCR